MANEAHLKILRRGVNEWNEWREANPEAKPDLSDANLARKYLEGVDLHDVDLTRANFFGTYLGEADLSGANLSMANLSEAVLFKTNLGRANLELANLDDANLQGADLAGANLTGADLRRANLSDAYLLGADLTIADLDEADLSRADLGCNFAGANLSGANLCGAELNGAEMMGAIFSETEINNVDLSDIRGLEMAVHLSPSSIGIDSIFKSRGEISEAFLRGAGVPNSLIALFPYFREQANGSYSCVINHSHKDKEFCKMLQSRMMSAELRVWLAPEDLERDDEPNGQLEAAVRLSDREIRGRRETQGRLFDKLLLVLSEHSIKREWLTTEVRQARQREILEERQILFPIAICPHDELRKWKLFDPDSGKDIAREVREYFITDFSNWKDHDAFETAFKRLLADLKGKEPPEAP